MIAGNQLVNQYRDELEAEAHVSTAGIRVVVTHPKFKHAYPSYRNGTIRLPACIFQLDGIWQKTWRHELQHADDDRSGLLHSMTRDEAETRARAAETTNTKKGEIND